MRKSLEDEFNNSLNAVVTINKIDVSFLTGQIKIYDLVIKGKGEFENDTLVLCREMIAEPGSFEKETSTLIFKRFITDNITVKSIVSESGISCWDNILKEDGTNSQDTSKQSFIFLDKLVITDGVLEVIDRSNNSNYKFKDINVVADFKKDSTALVADIDFRCGFVSDSLNITDIAFVGKMTSAETKTQISAILNINKFPVTIDFLMDEDSIENPVSHFYAGVDFSKLKFDDVKSSGTLMLNIDFSGFFNKGYDKIISAELIAEKLNFENDQNKSCFYANFISDVDIIGNEDFCLDINIKNLMVKSDKDTLKGTFNLHFSDTAIVAKSNLYGNINSIALNKIFDFDFWQTEFESEIKSDIDYYCSTSAENIFGKVSCNSKLKCPFFTVSESAVNFDGKTFTLESLIKTQIGSGKAFVKISDFINFVSAGQLKTEIQCDLDWLNIPAKKVPESTDFRYSDDEVPDFRITFPKRYFTKFTVTIDSLFVDRYVIAGIATDFIFAPEKISIESNSINIGDGKLNYFFEISKKNQDTVLTSDVKLESFNLNYFSVKEQPISGILDVKIENTIYFGKYPSSIAKNTGINIISLKGFCLPTGLFREYKIDEDTLKIEDFEASIILRKDTLIIEPVKLSINDIIAAVSGNYNFIQSTADISLLLDAPSDYLSPEVKLGLAVLSEKSAIKLPQKKGRITRHLKITGSLFDPVFKVYE